MYPDSEILFPYRCISQLRDLRKKEWADLVRRVAALPDGHEEVLAFSLMLTRMASCLTCDLDSYRASLGCCTCAQRTVAGFKGADAELVVRFEQALDEVREFLDGGKLPDALMELVSREG
jgi:hypothetical protein